MATKPKQAKEEPAEVNSIRHGDKQANIPTEELRDFVAEDEKLPKTLLTKGPKDAATRVYNLNPTVANTFLVTVKRTVVANISDITPEQLNRVADATTEMLATTR
jgi:hypothetical protein